LRLDSRVVLPDQKTERLPYVLRVEVDGKLEDLQKEDGRLDPRARFHGTPIGRRKELTLELPPGSHRVSMQLIGAAPGERCLVRARAPELDADAGES
jgi:hypothetical protein